MTIQNGPFSPRLPPRLSLRARPERLGAPTGDLGAVARMEHAKRRRDAERSVGREASGVGAEAEHRRMGSRGLEASHRKPLFEIPQNKRPILAQGGGARAIGRDDESLDFARKRLEGASELPTRQVGRALGQRERQRWREEIRHGASKTPPSETR